MSFTLFEIENDTEIILREINNKKLIRVKHDLTNREDFIHFSKSLGKFLEWDFGIVNELKIDRNTNNYLYSRESVPMHWDGAFKQEPHLLLFYCLEAPTKGYGGETLFTDTVNLIKDLTDEEIAFYQEFSLTYETQKLAHYGGKFNCKPINQHPITKQAILRFAERVDSTLNPVTLTIDGKSNHEQSLFYEHICNKIYDKKYCYQHTWTKGDLIIADNFSLLHGRNKISEHSPRHILRIQIL